MRKYIVFMERVLLTPAMLICAIGYTFMVVGVLMWDFWSDGNRPWD